MQATAHEPGLAVRRVDRPREQVELVADPRLVGVGLRGDILREELEAEPFVAADELEATAAALGFADRRLPIDVHAEPARGHTEGLATCGESDRDAGQARRALLEQALRGRR